MAVSYDETTEGQGGESEIDEWISSSRLDKIRDKIVSKITEDGATLDDLSNLTPTEAAELANEWGIGVIQRKRFISAIQSLNTSNNNKILLQTITIIIQNQHMW